MSQAQPPKPLTGRMVLFMMVAFFGVVIGVNLIMMRLAIQTLPGTEVDSAYSASLAYEKEIATARAQSARNWKVDAHVERTGRGGATLQVEAGDSYDQLRGVMIEAQVELQRDHEAVATLGTELLARYGGGIVTAEIEAAVAAQAPKRVAIRFVAQHTTSWDHRKLAGVY